MGPSLGTLIAWALTAHGVVYCSQGDGPALPTDQKFFLGR